MSALHPKIERYVIHAVAVLFLFSTIAASFLGYGVYQSGNNLDIGSNITTPVRAAPGPSWPVWYQYSWIGGVSSSTHTLPWNGDSGWNKYTSASNVVINSSGLQDDGSGTGELVSSIFNVGAQRAGFVLGISNGALSDAHVRSGTSIALVQSAPWTTDPGMACVTNAMEDQYFQYKLDNITSAPGQYETGVQAASALYYIDVSLKDATTGQRVNNANISVANVPYLVQDNGSGPYTVSVEYENSGPNYNLSISATGYQPTTSDIPVNSYNKVNCLFVTYDKTINLSPASAAPPSAPSSPKSSSSGSSVDVGTGNSLPANFDSTIVPLAEFQQTKLPTEFTAKGSKTTDLSKVADHKKISNFTLDIPGKNKIVFKDVLDLSARSTVDTLKNLSKYVKISVVGTAEVDSKAMPALNKKAAITMSGLSFVSAPQILIDGKVDTKNIVSNENYDSAKGVLTFDITNFSTFKAVPKIELLKPNLKTITDRDVTYNFRISDPNAKLTGSFNGIVLGGLTPDKKTGEFVVKKLAFEKGENILKLNATSKLGEVSPFAMNIKYDPDGDLGETGDQNFFLSMPFLVVAAGTFIIALILFLLLYRRRKRHEKASKAKVSTYPKPAENLQETKKP